MFKTDMGIALHAAYNSQQAKKEIFDEQGTAHVKLIKKATEEDIAWIKSMNGYVPSLT